MVRKIGVWNQSIFVNEGPVCRGLKYGYAYNIYATKIQVPL